MAGLGIKLYTDEMLDGPLCALLRQNGYDALSSEEAGNSQQRMSDETQLQFAVSQERAILTFNVGDFVRRETDWKAQAKEHYGIIVSTQISDVGELLRRVKKHLDIYPPEVQYNVLLWLHP